MSTDGHRLTFTKMHGAGNDYVYVSGFDQSLPDDLPALARWVAHRNTGIGGDGLILVLPPAGDGADVRMRMFNLDGSEGEMCGNGVRCVAKFAADRGLIADGADTVRVETGAGLRTIQLVREKGEVIAARVDMGEPSLGREAVGMEQGYFPRGGYFSRDEHFPEHGYHLGFNRDDVKSLAIVPVSMGNPHAVTFVDDLNAIDLPDLGPAIATHPAFAKGINAHFVQVLDRRRVRVLHWERGSGPTLACGTGACAVCVAGVVTDRTDRQIIAEVPGGELELLWDEATNRVQMTGPATEVFRGEMVL